MERAAFFIPGGKKSASPMFIRKAFADILTANILPTRRVYVAMRIGDMAIHFHSEK